MMSTFKSSKKKKHKKPEIKPTLSCAVWENVIKTRILEPLLNQQFPKFRKTDIEIGYPFLSKYSSPTSEFVFPVFHFLHKPPFSS